MKYQIACDNCGTQFIVEAEEEQTIERNCPHRHGLMEITLPLVSAGQQYEQSIGSIPQTQQVQGEAYEKGNNVILWGVVTGLLLLIGGVGAYFAFGSLSPETSVTGSIPNNTVPYESPIETEQAPSVDTVATVPAAPEQKEEEQVEEQPEEGTDTIVVPEHDE